MKLIRCDDCQDPVAISREWRNCECGRSGGAYNLDGDRATVAGPCSLYGISNELFHVGSPLGDLMREKRIGRGLEMAWPYDESNGKITRLPANQLSLEGSR